MAATDALGAIAASTRASLRSSLQWRRRSTPDSTVIWVIATSLATVLARWLTSQLRPSPARCPPPDADSLCGVNSCTTVHLPEPVAGKPPFRFLAKRPRRGPTSQRLLPYLAWGELVDGASGDTELASDMGGLYTIGDQLTHRVGIYTRLAAFVDAPRLSCLDTFKLPFASEVRLELCKYAEHIEKCFPAAVPVSIGCFFASSAMPLPFNSYTISCRSFIDRASRSIRVTTKVSPLRRKSSKTCSSVHAPRSLPDFFSDRMVWQPAARSAQRGFLYSRSCSEVDTRA
ncbi:hypothetical protein C8J41_10611 [Sphingomonas sp. PP-CC-3G-468]|nr:hypothetical protein C8J41_10611 [Sphingomonas sp. PP-CC-3G-468]